MNPQDDDWDETIRGLIAASERFWDSVTGETEFEFEEVTAISDPGDEWDAVVNAIYGGIFPPIPEPDPMTEDEVRDTLRGAAGDAEQTIDSAPCDEHKTQIKQAADLLRGVAQEIEDVQKDR